jgi:hypothetical protein
MALNMLITLALLTAVFAIGVLQEAASRFLRERLARRTISDSELPTLPVLQRDRYGWASYPSYAKWCRALALQGQAANDLLEPEDFEATPSSYRNTTVERKAG